VSLRSLVLAVPFLVLAAGCSTFEVLGISHKDGLEQVDELLTCVERVQVDSAVSKERSQAALEALRTLIAPEFRGDPVTAHQQFVAAVEQSEEQAEALQDDARPLRKTAESVFARWTEDLESFGNLAMRQRSQERLEETRRRYDAIMSAAVAAQLAYDAFNGDLGDHALFLEHDFNATSVGLASQELDGLKSRARELAKRLDACIAACQAYVEFSAPRAEVPGASTNAPAQTSETATTPEAPAKTEKKPAPKKKAAAKVNPTPSDKQDG
jgi:ElaB/YqjD/DUF883 family membrane-anchored ribosome-binding protein